MCHVMCTLNQKTCSQHVKDLTSPKGSTHTKSWILDDFSASKRGCRLICRSPYIQKYTVVLFSVFQLMLSTTQPNFEAWVRPGPAPRTSSLRPRLGPQTLSNFVLKDCQRQRTKARTTSLLSAVTATMISDYTDEFLKHQYYHGRPTIQPSFTTLSLEALTHKMHNRLFYVNMLNVKQSKHTRN